MMDESDVCVTVVAKHNRPRHPRGITPFGALKFTNVDAWEKAIRRAMAKAGGRVPEAAAILDISMRRLYRILVDKRFSDIERAPMGRPRERDS
jgi:hypothetical protein